MFVDWPVNISGSPATEISREARSTGIIKSGGAMLGLSVNETDCNAIIALSSAPENA